MAARIAGAGRIVAIDRSAERIALARALGASEGHVADGRTLTDFGIADLDHVLDTTGHAPLVEQGIDVLGPRGRIGLLAAFAPGTRLGFDATHVMSAGRVIMGIVEGNADPQVTIPAMIAHWRAGRFPIEKLVEFFPLDAIEQAIAAGESGRVVKPIVRMP